MTPPPGWYPDPSAPHQERWWDGTAWTEHRRAPEAAAYPPGPAAYPPDPPTVPPHTGAGPGHPAPARARAVALTTAAAVLVAAVVGAAVLLRDDDGADTDARHPPAPSAPAADPASGTPTSPAPVSSAPPADGPAVVEDQLNGITFPLPDGWVRPRNVSGADVVMTTDGTYRCPADGGVCRHGLVLSRTVTATAETSPEVLAREDIEEAAESAYDHDALDSKPFGGMTAHETVGSGPVAVAGRAGYYVRWRVTTAEGPGGYVQSMVFPSTVGTESPILVRYVFDAGEEGPPLTDMDLITKGIRPAGDAGTGGGVGSGIGRSG
ncbi:DUF2510 domain-containing protein [Streptomyces sp. NRRL F-5065]|uniref:DUF2510 domain-containing protein n=1 Tax=Streptomyces sp. NRRL F-5065 TaxID=1463855 RepID=UPI0004C1B88E|nr:DUF2510 domain-containing protein [Streptomyces sp. NRRL F-5065]